MLDKTAVNKFNAVPLSNDTVSHRVDVMATDSFALQLDESTDVSGSAQLVGFVRYRDANGIARTRCSAKACKGEPPEKIFLTS